jgi:hypothetical protein
MNKSTIVTPLPGDIADGTPRRLALDFGGLSEIIVIWGRLKFSDRASLYEPTKYELAEAVRKWWVDSAKTGWQRDWTVLSIDDTITFTGVLAYIRFDRTAGQDDWVDYMIKFMARERTGLVIPV